MGGWGSGKRWSSKSTTSDYIKLDVRRLQRDSVLDRRYAFSWKWTRDGEPVGDIVIRPEDDRMILTYRSRSGGPVTGRTGGKTKRTGSQYRVENPDLSWKFSERLEKTKDIDVLYCRSIPLGLEAQNTLFLVTSFCP